MKKDHVSENKMLNFLTSEIDSVYHQSSVKLGISDSVSIVMYAVYELGDGCLLSDIYKSSGISKQTIGSAIRSLEFDGILFLKRYDGRSKKVFLTEKGREFMKKTGARLYRAELDAFETWTEDEILTYIRLTEKFLDCFRRQIDKM